MSDCSPITTPEPRDTRFADFAQNILNEMLTEHRKWNNAGSRKGEDIEAYRLIIARCIYDLVEHEQYKAPPTNTQTNGLGVALGLLAWGLFCLIFLRFVSTPQWLLLLIYIAGFLSSLVGGMGLCIELPKWWKGKK